MMNESSARVFPEFSLSRLLKTVFEPKLGQRIGSLIDLADPQQIAGFAFLKDAALTIQRHAHDVFYQGLKNGVMAELGLRGGEMFAYQITGGSNLDLPDDAWTPQGRQVSLTKDVYPNVDILLCISTYSATAPLTAFAKQFGFRGATLHGVNPIILRTGLAVDYNEVSRQAEKLRQAMTRADAFEIDFEVAGRKAALKLLCDRQEAQKSHGLCRGDKPDVANLPAGEVYFVPTGADGQFPRRYEEEVLEYWTWPAAGFSERPSFRVMRRPLPPIINCWLRILRPANLASWDLARRNCRPRAATSRTRRSSARFTWPLAAAITWAGT